MRAGTTAEEREQIRRTADYLRRTGRLYPDGPGHDLLMFAAGELLNPKPLPEPVPEPVPVGRLFLAGFAAGILFLALAA